MIRLDRTVLDIRDRAQHRDHVFPLWREGGKFREVKGNYLIVDNGYHKVRGPRMVQGNNLVHTPSRRGCTRPQLSVLYADRTIRKSGPVGATTSTPAYSARRNRVQHCLENQDEHICTSPRTSTFSTRRSIS